MKAKNCNHEILQLLAEKSSTKQLVFRQTKAHFKALTQQIGTIAEELNSNICNIDQSVVVEKKDMGDFETQLNFSGDTVVFQMHTNVFTFDKNHHIWKNSYIKEDPMRAFFGVIHMYNFLSDSFKYQRTADYGQLLGRIFINKDNHFFMEGQRQFAFMFNAIQTDEFTNQAMRTIVEKSMLLALDIDLTAPTMNEQVEITVGQIQQFGSSLNLNTRKKLGFKFSFEKGNKVT